MQEQKEILRDRINGHASLKAEKIDRASDSEGRTDLCSLLLKYKGFSKQLSTDDFDLYPEDNNAYDGSKDYVRTNNDYYEQYALMNAMNSRKRRTMHFNSIAFMAAFDSAYRTYSADKGASFLTYFDRLYFAELTKEGRTQIEKNRLHDDRKIGDAVRKIMRLQEDVLQEGIPAKPSDTVLKLIMEKMSCSKDKAEEYYANARKARLETSYLTIEGENGEIDDIPVTYDDEPEYLSAEKVPAAVSILNALSLFADTDMKEYPKLFATNSVLKPLKEYDSSGLYTKEEFSRDSREYYIVLTGYEQLLWRGVFVPEYLEYVFIQPPLPDSLKNIYEADEKMPLNDLAIAKFKNVSKPNISQQRRKYEALMRNMKKSLDL